MQMEEFHAQLVGLEIEKEELRNAAIAAEDARRLEESTP